MCGDARIRTGMPVRWMRRRSTHTLVTLASLLLACVTTTMLLLHIESVPTCNDSTRRRLLLRATLLSTAAPRITVCEGQMAAFVLTDDTVMVLQDALTGIRVIYTSAPHIHQ